MDILDKLHEIEKQKCIYNIHYCDVGVGIIFYDPARCGETTEDYKKGLTIDQYYKTFEECIDMEYERLSTGE